MEKGALISDCQNYRYRLWRIWDSDKPTVMFIMLNPSTADAEKDDPTIRRCITYAKSWGFGGLYVGNLFAYRSTKPIGLIGQNNPVGRHNIFHISDMSKKCEYAICAWGNQKTLDILYKKGINPVKPISQLGIDLRYLELSKGGIPKHPLYLKSSLKPSIYH